MSTEKGGRDTISTSRDAAPESTSAGATSQHQTQQLFHHHQHQTETQPLSGIAQPTSRSIRESDTGHQTSQETQPSLSTTATASSSQDEHEQDPASPQPQQTPQTPTSEATERPRQVIAVSASKGPAAFFNLARKFLVTDEMCDLSALEGAIVSAVDAAHLLERSQLATIVRIQTSYVTVEPKRRKQPVPGTGSEDRLHPGAMGGAYPAAAASPMYGVPQPSPLHPGHQPLHPPPRPAGARGPPHGGRELRRARVVITVQRTESYKQWLAENPLQAIIAGDGDDDEDDDEEEDDEEEHVTSGGGERRKSS